MAHREMIGQLLDGRYRVVQILSSGAFGQTYLAVDTRRPNHPQCVVKQLRPPNNTSTILKTAYRLFKQEAEILEKLGKHNQIPFLLAYFEEGNQFYLVEEFIPGNPLTKEIIPGQPWPEDRVLSLLEEVLEVLEFVHNQGVIHRDVNPANLIRRKTDNKLVLIDFGSVKEVSQMANFPGEIPRTIATGTPSYMPIEQFQGNPQFNSDIYAVGMIGIQALTGLPAGELPKLQDPNPAHTGEIIWRNRAQCSSALANILDRMVHYNFAKRYPSATETLVALKKVRNRPDGKGVLVGQNPVVLSPTRSLPPLALRLLLVLAGVIAALVALALWNYWQRPDPIKAQSYLKAGVEKSRQGNATEAVAEFSRAIQLHPNNAEAFYKRANANYDLKQYEAAIADYTTAINLNPKYANAFFNRGLVRYDTNDVRGAIDDFTQALSLLPKDPEIYYKRGLAYFALQDFQAAIRDYTEVIQLEPKLAKAYHSRGLARAAVTDLQGAMGDYTEAIRLEPDNAVAVYSRGRARFHMGDYRGALADYSEVIRLDPQNEDAYANRCSTQLNVGAYQAAIGDCSQAIKLNPEDSVAYNNRCIGYLNLRESEKAIADCGEAIRTNPKNANAYNNRGLAHSAAGQQPQAIEDYTAAIGLNPNDAEAYANRAKAYYELKDYNNSIADYVQAIRLNPNFATAYYGRGAVRRALGDKQGAKSDFEKAGKLYLDQGRPGGYKDAQFQIEQIK